MPTCLDEDLVGSLKAKAACQVGRPPQQNIKGKVLCIMKIWAPQVIILFNAEEDLLHVPNGDVKAPNVFQRELVLQEHGDVLDVSTPAEPVVGAQKAFRQERPED